MTHRKALAVMLAATLMWSIAGVVTRQLQDARSFEITFWRSASCAVGLIVILWWMRGGAGLLRTLRDGGRALWVSGLCWAVMFTAFMVALTITTVANVLVTLAIGPLLTALVARFALGQRLPLRTWLAIGAAGIGIAWMFGTSIHGGRLQHLVGSLVALLVPIAAAVNWTVLQHLSSRQDRENAPDMLVAVLIGAVVSALASLPLALPFVASATDVGWLSMLGVVQLAIPCLMVVAVTRVLSAPEVSLLGLLEVVFGTLWAWLGAGEVPNPAVFGGGTLVLAALLANGLLSMRRPTCAKERVPAPSGVGPVA
ncbi:MAG: DMT family transporter [Rubrivivax sp.]